MREIFGGACVALCVVACVCLPGHPALADQTTVGVSINGTSGHHVESTGIQSVPLLPLPMIEIDHRHKNVAVSAEIVPPIGPVALGQNNLYGYSQEPRLSYIDAEIRYLFPNSRYELGIGETILNQRTLYPPSPLVQASRVVGTRYVGRAAIFSTPQERLDLDLAVDPALHGIQYSIVPGVTAADAESGSLVDTTLRWSIPHGRSTFTYGLRYINYSAHYQNGNLADRNHLLMPFMGFNWDVCGRSTRMRRPLFPVSAAFGGAPAIRKTDSTFGFTVSGASGSDSIGGQTVARPFALVPEFELARRSGRLRAYAGGYFPTANVNLFGSPRHASSFFDSGVLYYDSRGRYAIGMSETAINIDLRNTTAPTRLRWRNEGLRLSVLAPIAVMPRERVDVLVGIVPYLHATSYFTGYVAQNTIGTLTSSRRGSLVDARLRFLVRGRSTDLEYGLRYVNQAIDLTPPGGPPGFPGLSALFQHDSSLLPFVGFVEHIGGT